MKITEDFKRASVIFRDLKSACCVQEAPDIPSSDDDGLI